MSQGMERRMSPFFDGENEESLVAAISDVRKGHRQKNEYVVRPSPLDDLFENTTLRKSLFLGIYHLLITVIIVYIVNHCLVRLLYDKSVLDPKLFYQIQENAIPLAITFALCTAYSFVAFFVQKLVILLNMNMVLAQALAYSLQYSILLLPLWVRFNFKWTLTHYMFTTVNSFIFLLKMHSYAATNFELRKEYLATIKEQRIPSHGYPKNVTFWNYVYYIRVPALVYEVEYPRSKEGFRLRYLLIKLFLFILLIVFAYLMASDCWIPLCNNFVNGKIGSVLELYIRSVCPFGAIAFALFLLTFEYACNCYAELTTFGDRLFYQDFWNCTSYDEFGRKWNRIVHEFLYRHLYLPSLKAGLSPAKSYLITLGYSAVLHEYFLLCTLGMLRPYITILMLSQLFMNFLYTAILRLKKGTTLGNHMYWLSLLFGQAYLVLTYTVDYLDATK